MTRRFLPLLPGIAALALAAGSVCAAPDNPAIRNYPLDEYSVQTVPVSRDTVTTVSFPGPSRPSRAAGSPPAAGGRSLPDRLQQGQLLSFPAHPGARRAGEPQRGLEPQDLCARRGGQHGARALGHLRLRRRQGEVGLARRRHTQPAFGHDGQAKSFPLLAANYPQAVADVEVARPGTPTDYPQFVVTVDEVYRFPQADTLVFRLTFKNKTAETVTYAPNLLGIRAGDLVYTNAISDASGTIPPNGTEPAYLAITGTPTGGRNDLSIKNPFYVVVSSPAPAPSLFPARNDGGNANAHGDGKSVVAPLPRR